MDRDDIVDFFSGEDTSIECLQVAPLGNGRSAILFLLSDSDYETTISVIFVVDDFDPATARVVLMTEEWLTALSGAPSGELFALEATVWVWRYAGAQWTRDQIGTKSLRQIWASDPAGAIAVGAEGVAYRLVGSNWEPIEPVTTNQYLDVFGDPKHGIVACGDLGTVHRLVGTSWQALDLHRHETFYGVDVAADGTVRVAGEHGICIRIANEEVTEIEPVEDLTYLGVRTHQGRAYWGDERELDLEVDDALVPFKETGTASDLRTDGEFLYVAGIDTAWRFDGKQWKTLTLTYEDEFRLE